jgi:cation diffusion facilitator CzcD-associated flavoprotein CzcO
MIQDCRHKYCIVGAGPSGLAQARAFDTLGIDYDVFERHSDVGGVWDIENPGSPMYQTAHLVVSRESMAYAGYPWPAEFPDFPRHDQVLSYLRGFAAAFGLKRRVRFDCPVSRVTPNDEGAAVEVDGATRQYRGVVCATGWQWQPNLPAIPGRFEGVLRHSQSYKDPEELRGKRVLVIGLGHSGADIASDAARVARATTVSVRRGYHVIPKTLFGKPADRFGYDAPPGPAWLERSLFGFIHRLLVGDLGQYGMPKPEHAITEAHPLVSDQLLDHLRHGRVTIRGNVERFEGKHVVFEDDSRLEVDEVVCATGYKYALPYVEERYLTREGDKISHYLTCFSRQYPTLFTLGLAEFSAALLPQVDLWSFLIAHYAVALKNAPATAQKFQRLVHTDRPDLTGGHHMVASDRHVFYCNGKALRHHTQSVFKKMRWPTPAELLSHSPPALLPVAAAE